MAESSETQVRRSRRFVLREFQDRDSVVQVATELGWPLERVTEPDHEAVQDLEILWKPGPGLALRYVEDFDADESYVVVSGRNAEGVRGVEIYVEARLPAWSLDDLVRKVDEASTDEERAQNVLRLGLGAPIEMRDDFVRRISDAIQDKSLYVRQAGVWAVAHAEWPVLLPLVRQVAENDPEEEIRDDAMTIVDVFGEAGMEG